jgi:hypothetical protein
VRDDHKLSIDPQRGQLDRRCDPRYTACDMRHKHRSPVAVVQEWRLPGPERRAARAERRVEAQLRRERDSEWTAERRAAAIEAERRRYDYMR